MANKGIMSASLRLLKEFREALGKARIELRKKALSEMEHNIHSDALDKFYGHDRDLESVNFGLGIDIQKLSKVSDDGDFWLNYNEKGERKCKS